MKLNLEELISIYPNELYLEVSPQQREEAWAQTQNYSNKAARWNAYLNLLALKVFVSYIQEEPDLREQLLKIELNDVDSSTDSWVSSIWEFVNGTGIKVGNTRLVIIPEEVSVFSELCIPQEWVDIADWAADYYLGMEVNLEDEWLRIYGYATHKQLKEQGKYEPMERTYSLNEDDLITDLNVMWVAQKLCSVEKAETLPLPQLSPTQAEDLVAKLGKHSTYSPRLDLAFEKWAALLVNDQWRQKLYQQRLEEVQVLASGVPIAIGKAIKPLANLGQLLQNFLEDGWQTVEETRKQLDTEKSQLAYGFGGTRFQENSPKIVPALIELLRKNPDSETRFKAIDLLGEIGQGNEEAIATLGELANTSKNQELRRQAAVVLGKIEPSNPQAGVRRVKMIDLGMQLDGNRVAFVITFIPEANGETNVQLRVYPAGERNYLPPNLQLIVINEQGEKFLEALSRSADNWIQLEFNGECTDSFTVKLVLEEACFSKEFVL